MYFSEYNVECQPTLSEKVLKDKRKKLKETLDRVLKLYEKENPEYWIEIRRMEGDYEKKRQARIEYYEAVRHAQAVTVDEIPLPNLDMPPLPEQTVQPVPQLTADVGNHIPVPNSHITPVHSILKKPVALPTLVEPKKPPGCPPTLPPELSDDEEDEKMEVSKEKDGEDDVITGTRTRTIRFADGDESDEDKDTRLTLKKSKNLTSLQTKLLEISGQDIDDFMRETEVLFKEKVAERQADFRSRIERIEEGVPPNLQQPPPGVVLPMRVIPGQLPTGHLVPPFQPGPGVEPGGPNPNAVPSGPPGLAPTGVPPPLMLRPPPRAGPPLMPGVRMPRGPPPQGLPPRLPNMRLPPPIALRPPLIPPLAPPGMPPPGLPLRAPPPGHNPNVLSAAPQLIARPKEDDKKNSATIEAKPQIRQVINNIYINVTLGRNQKRQQQETHYFQPNVQIPS